jgi:hypothetical protein
MIKPQRKYWLLVGNCKDYDKCSKHMKQKKKKKTGEHEEHKVPQAEASGCGIEV